MAYRAKVLQKKAEKFELKKLQVLQVTKERVSALEPLLQDVYANRRPKTTDYEVRRDLVRVFNEIAKELYGNSKDIPVVVEFGSFVMDLFGTTSDLDLSVNFNTATVPFPREKKIQTLRKFAKKLYALQSKGHVSGVLPITTAKVPILKCVDRGTGVECDISVENRDGILKSRLIHIISSIDERFHKLSFLMKTWAKAHNINSSKDKTLNSLSIILLVAFHLQTRNPPILPPFSALFKDGTDPAMVVKSLSNFVNYGKRNKESLAELFVTLLIKLSSVEKLWAKGLCASTRNASWTSKTWDSKVASISVEDFTDQSQNVSRAVGQAEVKQIYKCIDISIRYIFSFMDGQIGVTLRDLLFGQDGIPTPIPIGTLNLLPIAALPCTPHANQPRRVINGKRRKQAMHSNSARVEQAMPLESAKRMRTAEGWIGMPNGSRGVELVEGRVGTQLAMTFDPTKGQQPIGGGWVMAQQPAAGGWGVTRQPSTGGWGVTKQPTAEGWGGTQQSSTGGWGGAWHLITGGWGETQQSSAGGWRGGQPSSTAGWGATQQSRAGGRGTGQASSATGWGGGQSSIAGGRGGMSNGLRRADPYYRSF
ncbi:S-M checkpoint control protein CID1 [Handroanthus impetiginosus]|uniref:S-M checkpoint control protein CID1 n=1 Tax=Handroanthus impetiginosus TaxID=429701 RepID=A0A2G9HW41_9LAMI|nr:S-M checkpoint control protein CID1 [Handroanthus impetiginosus]